MINKVILIGRLVEDSELRVTNSGQSVTSFRLAVNRSFQSQDRQEADFINCVVWGKSANAVNEYTHKGSLVAVEGSLRSRSYDSVQGHKVYVVEVVCNSVQFLELKQKQQQQQQQQDNEFYQNIQEDLESNKYDSFDIMEDDTNF